METDDCLYEFALEDRELNAALLNEYLDKYPEHRETLIDLAVELALDRLRGEED